MSEQLYSKSWEPLSEADKSEPQVVRVKSEGAPPSVMRFTGTSWGNVWTEGIAYIDTANLDRYEFLCLTPVEHEPSS